MHGSVLHHVLAAREGPQHVVEILGDQVLTLRPCNRLGSASKAVPLAGAGQGDEHVQKGQRFLLQASDRVAASFAQPTLKVTSFLRPPLARTCRPTGTARAASTRPWTCPCPASHRLTGTPSRAVTKAPLRMSSRPCAKSRWRLDRMTPAVSPSRDADCSSAPADAAVGLLRSRVTEKDDGCVVTSLEVRATRLGPAERRCRCPRVPLGA